MSKPQQSKDLPKPARALLGAAGVVDAALRVYCLIDIAKRPADEVNGPKVAWIPALALVSSLGALPAAYLLWGRKR